jgi:deoxyuridine 5'-triphosphate nucleotidohydrolase
MATQNDTPILRYVKLTPNAVPPTRESTLAAGLNLRSAYDHTIPAFGKGLVETDLAIMLPPGWYGKIVPLSGLALHHHLSIGVGVIDAYYRCNVCVILFNHSVNLLHIRRGDRIAQLICERIVYPDVCEVQELDETVCATGGFGSSESN